MKLLPGKHSTEPKCAKDSVTHYNTLYTQGQECPRKIPRGHGDDAGEDHDAPNHSAAERGRPRPQDSRREHPPLLQARRGPYQGFNSINNINKKQFFYFWSASTKHCKYVWLLLQPPRRRKALSPLLADPRWTTCWKALCRSTQWQRCAPGTWVPIQQDLIGPKIGPDIVPKTGPRCCLKRIHKYINFQN